MRTRFFLSLGVVVAGVLAVTAWELAGFTPLPEGVSADRIVVKKRERTMTIYRGAEPLKSYQVSLGSVPEGAKRFEGDGRTPEGHYTIDSRKADSSFHLALHVSYPDAADRAAAVREGKDPGGAIMIHGLRNGLGFVGSLHRVVDWTNGCIAVTNREIEELWRVVPDGTPIELEP